MHIHTNLNFHALWRAHRIRIAAAACGFLTCLVTSSDAPLYGYLRTAIERQRQEALSSSPARRYRIPRRTPRKAQLSRGSPSLFFRSALGTRAVSRSSSASSAKDLRRAELTTLHAGPENTTTPVSSISSISRTPASSFPAFDHTVYPVASTPNWGAMTTPAEWERTYAEMTDADFVPLPAYDLSKLTVPLQSLVNPRNIEEITRKLLYSTRFFSAYDIDLGEFTGNHPGIDLKLALGTPLRAIAGGRVQSVADNGALGLYIAIEHRHPTDGVFFSVYGHLASAAIKAGQDVTPGQYIGNVGMTGNTSGPHVHWQIDHGHEETVHTPYAPITAPSAATAEEWTLNPIRFVQRYAAGE